MKVTLFGATGTTGKYLIDEALKRGIDVTVFARSSSSFENAKVKIVRGELTDNALLREAVSGSDAVVSALGPTKLRHPKDLPITRATEAIISAMKQVHVQRLIAISTGMAVDPGDRFDWKIRLPATLIKYLMRSCYNDILALAKVIRASGLDWTMVRVAFLRNDPAIGHLNVGLYGVSRHSLAVNREDLARFMFDQITERRYIHQAPGISTK
ncbi:putative NADH-flavin reductase [Bradyrhizobium huanghuaihaiense]|uniref:Putative NADH-flavin reductase n=1 Tax=Bradyrhizobium huanghuaihaiense TaxID=990078 RepID=A0A562RXM7_9BRAD|nr:NAD(P)H-binding protein [Bradyrhizobium huanghuaihaiense]TWI73802.1 putative NADH-flavin reductase [Bradyrhizobium huanghuaihaiense]